VLRNPDNPARSSEWIDLQQAADTLAIQLTELPFQHAQDIDRAFEDAASESVEAIIVVGEPMISVERARLARLASANHLPLMFERGELVEAGGLMSYGVPLAEVYRRSATYIDRILKGANPAELPIELPARYELAINLKTARDLRLTLSLPLLMQADRLIQ
jgi:putative ABC transport system substrate-binding protein